MAGLGTECPRPLGRETGDQTVQQDPSEFFRRKKPWSKYKDAILDYYLKPYLPKVATLGRPIAVIDCFAGPGKFGDGLPGSPLIIAKHLQEICAKGKDVRAVYIEADDTLFDQLCTNVASFDFPVEALKGDFRGHTARIREIAETHSVFIYLDPMRPGQLKFNDLQPVYDQLHRGRSVEALINFLTPLLLRRAQGLLPRATEAGVLDITHHEVLACDEIAGGQYWQGIVADPSLSTGQRAEQIADGYVEKLRRRFRWVLHYPIRQTINMRVPKYHLVFGSRSHHAVDLMNRAMVTARREFVRVECVEWQLFENQPLEEVVDEGEILAAVLDTASNIGKTKWALLRAHATVRYPCRFTDSEFNKAIKEAIRSHKLGGDCSGTRIEENVYLWPMTSPS